MTRPLIVNIPHALAREEAARRLKRGLARASSAIPIVKFEEETWSGDHLSLDQRTGPRGLRNSGGERRGRSHRGSPASAAAKISRNGAGRDPVTRTGSIGKKVVAVALVAATLAMNSGPT
jgi:hypothetical protein